MGGLQENGVGEIGWGKTLSLCQSTLRDEGVWWTLIALQEETIRPGPWHRA